VPIAGSADSSQRAGVRSFTRSARDAQVASAVRGSMGRRSGRALGCQRGDLRPRINAVQDNRCVRPKGRLRAGARPYPLPRANAAGTVSPGNPIRRMGCGRTGGNGSRPLGRRSLAMALRERAWLPALAACAATDRGRCGGVGQWR
jgi:hypothetical protein